MFPESSARLRVVLIILYLALLAPAARFAAPIHAAPQADLTFTAVGDLGGTANTDGVLAGIANAGTDFHLALGDLSYGSYAPESAWCSYVQSHVGTTFPFELGAGNHDMDAQPTGDINNFVVCLPDRIGSLTGTYGKEYYFDVQNLARVIFISPDLTLDGETYSYNSGTPHYAWLVNAIESARSANVPWVIVGMHKNCISTGVKSCEIGSALFNLLVSEKVDLVLQGHDHNYQRSKQLALNANCTAIVPGQFNAACVVDDGADHAYDKGAGMVVNIVGTGGQSLYGSNPFDTEAGYFARIVNPGVDVARYGFLRVNVTATQLRAQFVGTSSGSAFGDAYTINALAPLTTLAAFSAAAISGPRVRLKWTTSSESNVTAFNIWRAHRRSGTFVKLNAIPIPAKNARLSDGAQYKRRDKQVLSGKRYFYKLQVVHSDATSEWSDILKVKVP
jgi:hypothetical protein